MEYLDYIIVAAVAAWIAWHARGIVFLANISQNPDRIIDMLKEIKKINEEEGNSNNNTIEVTIETVNGQIYAYTKSNGEFLGQGPTIEAALELAVKRFPGKTFWCEKLKESSQTA